MAKITLTIEADGPVDLHRTLADLCDRLEGNDPDEIGRPLSSREYGDGDELSEFGAPHPEQLARANSSVGEQNGAGKRRRRTKAELEADPEWRAKNGLPPLDNVQSAAPASPTSASATVAPAASPANLDFTRRPLSQPSAAGAPATEAPKAIFGVGGSQIQSPAAPPAGDAEASFKAAFRQSMSTRGAKATQDILVAVAGVRMTAEVKPEQYAAVTAAFLAS